MVSFFNQLFEQAGFAWKPRSVKAVAEESYRDANFLARVFAWFQTKEWSSKFKNFVSGPMLQYDLNHISVSGRSLFEQVANCDQFVSCLGDFNLACAVQNDNASPWAYHQGQFLFCGVGCHASQWEDATHNVASAPVFELFRANQFSKFADQFVCILLFQVDDLQHTPSTNQAVTTLQ